jgi:hypothetical protein
MTQRQITNHKSNHLLVLVGGSRVLPEIILKFRHLKYRRSDKILAIFVVPNKFIMKNRFNDISNDILTMYYKY